MRTKRDESTIRAYREHVGVFRRRRSQAGRGVSPFLRETLALLPEKARVLDLGCGTGEDARIFARPGHRVVGIDPVSEFIAFARERVRGANFLEQGMLDARFPARSFDLVWANASLIHLPKSELPVMLGRIRRWLRKGGLLAATIHNGRREGIHPGTWIPGRFFASYLKEELSGIVERGGFEIEEIRGAVNEDRKGRWINLRARK